MVEAKLNRAVPQEIALRRERARVPFEIQRASKTVENLRGNGHREGDAPLDEALRDLRSLIDRQAALDDLILDEIVKRCRGSANRLATERNALSKELDALRNEARSAWSKARVARREAEEITSRAEGVAIRSDALGTEEGGYRAFCERAVAFAGNAPKRRKLLEEAWNFGLMLPMPNVSPYEEEDSG